MKSIFLYGLFVWFIILFLAVINGIVRDYTYKSDQVSSIILSILIFVVTFFFLKVGRYSEEPITYIALGLMWMILTMAFEFLFFHYAMGHSWDALIANYDIVHGNLWLLVVLSIGLAPIVTGRVVTT